ncbi:hypothetical protein B0O99DRAFT_707121 [Bisporella sp. PMI_857]|nr:hypothetical protein B0O99DRAFT_707121 [Bisporella sp. PMI_857]
MPDLTMTCCWRKEIKQLYNKVSKEVFTINKVNNRLPQYAMNSTTDVIAVGTTANASEIASETYDSVVLDKPLPLGALRLWIYETAPANGIKYVVFVDPVGELHLDSKPDPGYAYKVIIMHGLRHFIGLEEMKEKGWLEEEPKAGQYLPRAMQEALTPNAKFREPTFYTVFAHMERTNVYVLDGEKILKKDEAEAITAAENTREPEDRQGD